MTVYDGRGVPYRTVYNNPGIISDPGAKICIAIRSIVQRKRSLWIHFVKKCIFSRNSLSSQQNLSAPSLCARSVCQRCTHKHARTHGVQQQSGEVDK